MQIDIPELCLVLLVGPSAAGKSSFARRHFLPTEVVSSDDCRAMLADDPGDQSVTDDAFELMHHIVGRRLRLGRLAVVDATNVQPAWRKGWIALAKQYHVFCVAIVFDLPEKLLLERHAQRGDRHFGDHVIRHQRQDLLRSLRGLEREGCRFVHVFREAAQVDAAAVTRTRLWANLRHETGPFDIVGDVHGCFDELMSLLQALGYAVARSEEGGGGFVLSHPAGRRLVFVGDLVDRGPNSPDVIRLVRSAVRAGIAFCVAGNHDAKLARALNGRGVKVTHGLEQSLAQLSLTSETFRREAADFLDGLLSHYVLDGGRLVVAHAGLSEDLQGRSSGRVRSFAMYGETTGETDEFGLPVRYPWAEDYRGKAMVVYGHTPVPQAEWLNNTLCIDTGCVFGGRLTALRYPERELASVPAQREYYAPVRPPAPTGEPQALSAQQAADDLLDYADVSGRRYIRTSLYGTVQVREENAAAALEVMSRFAANPKWLIHLPPTMSPSETSQRAGLLEHPDEAFAYYRQQRVARVVCEEKHMGSRAVIVLCRDEAVARRRFGVAGEGIGLVHTRTGRAFFNDKSVEQALLQALADGLQAAGLWDELATGWVCLDAELMPWSAKALDLIRSQYAPVGAAGAAMLAALQQATAAAVARGAAWAPPLHAEAGERLQAVQAYRQAYAPYCWDVAGLAGLRVAPFHLLASEGRVHTDRDHAWHMATLARLAVALPDLCVATPHRTVDLADPAACGAAAQWWDELTGRGGEGMVVKPLEFVARGRKGLLQPAIKCRGPEYLRLIYGPEYTRPAHLERLRERGLSAKRSLALKEFALGVEALQRFVAGAPLRQVHECVFAVLALESEPVDPRL
jgi:protein phosphatase